MTVSLSMSSSQQHGGRESRLAHVTPRTPFLPSSPDVSSTHDLNQKEEETSWRKHPSGLVNSFIGQWASASQISYRRVATCRKLSTPSPTRQHSSQRPNLDAPKQARAFPPIILLGLLLVGGTGYYFSAAPSRPDTLNDRFFVPYTVTAREAISPTSFVITIVPHTPNPAHPYLVPSDSSAPTPGRWRHPLWSVEFKQPEVQISRHYTPLPPLSGEDPADGALRFYIRTVGDGEMSHYLARRQVGQDVHLRGPHIGFELTERLGDKSRVVFLAGGTGVVPGMQAAKAVLEANPDTRVDLLWAVRNRVEVQRAAPPPTSSWRFWQEKKQPSELEIEIQDPSPVARHLGDMKAKYGDRLKIQVVIDEEGTKFQDKDIKSILTTAPSVASSAVVPSKSGCRFHDQMMHIGATEFAAPEASGCICPSSEGSVPGKNLIIISGPDGFIEHYAGQKLWLTGHQTQGPVDGVIGRLQRQEPQLAQDWLVLKM
ncbi:putative FAD-binding protein C17H9.12c [Ilyonectria robusta]